VLERCDDATLLRIFFFFNDPPPICLEDDNDDDDGDGLFDGDIDRKADGEVAVPLDLDLECGADADDDIFVRFAVLLTDAVLDDDIGAEMIRFCSKSSSSFSKGLDNSFFLCVACPFESA